ncbi:hypothetical protein V6N12_020675 [Hibiscus sabdariffa]|uniref:Uncharacterized protein n=1 Tax=Hibiscus sabdariffa TaxID=183260 RepID=A0ABR2CYU7_9ROSI
MESRTKSMEEGSARKATLEENKEGKSVHVQEDSLSNSFSKSSRSRPSETVAGSKLQVEDETLNTCVIGKERNKSEAANDFGSSRFLGESDLKSNENNVEIPSNNVISSGEGKLGLEQEKCIPDSLNDKEKSKAEKATNGRIEDMAQEVVMVGLDNNPISWANIVSNNLKGHNDGDYLDPTMACNQIVGGAVAVEKPSYSHSSTGPRRLSYLKCFWFDVWIVFQERSFALATVGAVHTDFGGASHALLVRAWGGDQVGRLSL